MKKKNSSSYL